MPTPAAIRLFRMESAPSVASTSLSSINLKWDIECARIELVDEVACLVNREVALYLAAVGDDRFHHQGPR